MATTYTEHLQIPKHDPTDPFNIALINEGFDKTEAGILMAFRGMAAYNKLRNYYFLPAYVINQRGKTAYTGNGYSIDCWRAYHAATTHTVTASGLAVSATDNNPNLYQVIEPGTVDDTKTYTAVVCDSDGNAYIWVGKPTTATSTPVCIYYNGSTLLFRATGEKTWLCAGLFEGEYTLKTRPSIVPNRPACELLECQRHAIVLGGAFRYRSTQITGGIIDFSIPLPVRMRARPTFDTSALTIYSLSNGAMTAQSGFTFAIVLETATGIVIRATKANHGVTDAMLSIAEGTVFSADQ